MKLWGLIAFVLALQANARPLTESDILQLQVITSPVIEGNTLYIKGPIDSHIYDFLSMEHKRIKSQVKRVSLNSLGGNHNWAMEIARKLREFNLATILEKDAFCASACVYLFGAGLTRWAHESTWFGIHGARLGKGYKVQFHSKCFEPAGENQIRFSPRNKSCQEYLTHWYETTSTATYSAFARLFENGISRSLLDDYLSLEDDPAWPGRANIFRKPDWEVSAREAAAYNLVTDFLEDNDPFMESN